jgi:6-pyruvoyltetrahydropterin/6-carboxytetrahydropterin synthase
VAEVTAQADSLDNIGRVIDFSVIKRELGAWLDDNWDHAMVVNQDDIELLRYLQSTQQRHYIMTCNPTAENMAQHLMEIGNILLQPFGVSLVKIKLWETPNCFVEVTK